MGHFYDMKNRFWAVGCGLGWAVGKKVWADYEQLLREVFSIFCGQKKNENEKIVASALKSCIKKVKKNIFWGGKFLFLFFSLFFIG